MYLSVIIPTRNRSSLLEKAIKSLTRQTYLSENFEIIIVDNGSTDETKSVVESYKHDLPNLIYLYEPKPGLHVGRHAGLAIAKGEILVYGDDDIEAFPTWLEGVAESFQDPAVVLVGGNVLPQFESAPPEWIEQLWQETPWGKAIGEYSLIDFGSDRKEILPNYVYGCNFSIQKSILLEVGGFHPDSMPKDLLKYRGDGESAVSDAIRTKKYKVIFNPKASVYHHVSTSRMTFSYIQKRGYLQGISDSYSYIRKRGHQNFVNLFQAYYNFYKEICLLKIRKTLRKIVSPNDFFALGHLEGYLYYQREVYYNSELLEWVLKKDYFIDSISDDSHLVRQ